MMDELVDLHSIPKAEEMYMIAGWNQWADAGSVSSGLPGYLVDHLNATKIGKIKPAGFYLFQIPGMHHLLRPEVDFEEGYSAQIKPRDNDFFYYGNEQKGLVIFHGEEPHTEAERYADAFFSAAKQLGVRRVAVVGGVYGAMPYDKEREISCTYSMQTMKDELVQYAVRFSSYNGGATIGSFLVDRAEQAGLELLVFNAFVPAYDFSQPSMHLQGIRIENDYKAWYELMRRFNYMFGLSIELSDLDRQSEDLLASIDAEIDELATQMPQLNIRDYIAELTQDFNERPFMPLDDIWEQELGDLFGDLEE